MLYVFVCAPVHVSGHSERCRTVIVMDFNVYWAALLEGCNCKIWDTWIRRQFMVTEAQNHDEGRGERTVTGVHWSVTGIQNKSVTDDMEKRVSTKV